MMTCDICGRTIARRSDGELLAGTVTLASLQHRPAGEMMGLIMAKGIHDLDVDCAKELAAGLIPIRNAAEAIRQAKINTDFDALRRDIELKNKGKP